MASLRTDYLIVGSGASGLAFADTLLEESDSDIVIVDRHGRPGGHWNDAYAFVRLHQPSAFYGVNSLELSDGERDRGGLNDGLLGLASRSDVAAYFERVMDKRLLPSGRVRYLPMTEWLGDGRLRSILGGGETTVDYRTLVDSTYYGTTVPSTHTPSFPVSGDVRLVPPNALPDLWKGGGDPDAFVILGGGKTGMDAAAWLLQNGVGPDAIHWVRPRDAWLLNRALLQPGLDFFESSIAAQTATMRAWTEARDAEDMFDRLEAAGCVLRIDPAKRPAMFHYATSSPAEVALLGSIGNVLRRGKIAAITRGRMTFEDGSEAVVPDDALFVDCTASAVTRNPPVPLWHDDRITLQMIRIPQPCFSAALTAYIDTHFEGDDAKNRLARPIPLPDAIADYPRACLVNMVNQKAWGDDRGIRHWLARSRLDGFAGTIAGLASDDRARRALVDELRAAIPPAVANLMRIVQAAA